MQVTHYTGNAVFALSAGVDVLIAWALVAWAARRRPLLPRLALGGALVLGLLAVKGLLLLKLGVERHFGVLHVLWLDFVVVMPLAAVLLGLLTWRHGGAAVRALVVAGLLAAPVGAVRQLHRAEPSRRRSRDAADCRPSAPARIRSASRCCPTSSSTRSATTSARPSRG